VLYFAYGSNMSRTQMAERCPGAALVGVARLPRHRLAFNRESRRWGGQVASIVGDEAGEVWGALWEVTAEHMEALDRWEGVAGGAYRRQEVRVEQGGAAVEAMAYVVGTPGAEGPPAAAYLSVLLEAARELGLDADYVRALAGR
jgi:gamma-glutamylcyclotransferase